MGAVKQSLLEPQPGDEITIRCDRCGEKTPYWDATDGDLPLTKERAEEIRESFNHEFVLCSYCQHMTDKGKAE